MSIMRIDIKPTDILFINSEQYKTPNEFDLIFENIDNMGLVAPDYELNQGQTIEIEIPLGDGPTCLCSPEEAENITITHAGGEGEWRIDSEVDYDECTLNIKLRPRKTIKPTTEHLATFLFSEITTTSADGTVVSLVTLNGFEGVKNTKTSFSLHKYYPVVINSFKADPARVDIGGDSEISWAVTGAKDCYINHPEIGDVEPYGSKKVKLSAPVTFELSASDYRSKIHRASCNVGMNKPRFVSDFVSNTDYFTQGEPVTLSWEVESFVSISLTPGGSDMPAKHTIEVYPDGDTTYVLKAIGYDEAKLVTVEQSVTVRQRSWRNIGSSALPPEDKATSFNDSLFGHNGKIIIYANKQLYENAGGTEWEEIEGSLLEVDAGLEKYTTMFTDNTIYILGGANGESANSMAAMYSFEQGTWSTFDMGLAPPNRLYASACAEKTLFKHANLADENLMILGVKNELSWNTDQIIELDGVDAVRVAVFKGITYLAMRDKATGDVTIVKKGEQEHKWQDEATIEQKPGEWFGLLPCGNIMYFINGDGIRKSTDWEIVRGFYPVSDCNKILRAGIIGKRLNIMVSGKLENTAEIWSYA